MSAIAWAETNDDRQDIRHAGVDPIATPGSLAVAPVDGIVKRIGRVYEGPNPYHYVEIAARDELVTRLYYITPTVKVGDHVVGGVTTIGRVENLQPKYPGITDHVHLEIRDPSMVGNPTAFTKYERYAPINPTPFLKPYPAQGAK